MIMQMRQKRILEILREKRGWITGKELSTILSVSDRTIRSDIDQLGRTYEGLIESSVRYGYRINQDVLEKSNLELKENIPQTSDERCKYIIERLLFHTPRLHIFDLQYDIYVSEFTIRNDIRKISDMLKKYDGIELVKAGNYIYLEGSEERKRYVYKDMLANETRGNFINLNKIDQILLPCGFDPAEQRCARKQLCG